MQRWATIRRRITIVISAMALLATAQWAPPVYADELQDRLKNTQQELENLKAAGRQARARLKEVEDQARAASAAHEKSVADLAAARTASAAAAIALKDGEASLATAEAELKVATERVGARRKTLASRVRAVYVEGQVEYLDVLFASADFSDFLTRYEFLRMVLAQDSRLVQELKDLHQQSTAKRAAATRRRDELARLRQDAALKEAAVAQRVEDVQRLQTNLARQRSELEVRIDEVNRTAERLNEVILELQREMARRAGKLDMRFPVDGVEITDAFGMRWHPILNKYKMHYGTDFAANYGQPVYAAEDGRILLATWDDAYGYYLVIDHGNSGGKLVSTLYAHNTTLLAAPGQEVKRGQVIARAGSTGWSTGPHVHFEVRVNGTPQQPLDWLPKS